MSDAGSTSSRRVLLDENLPRQLVAELPGHDVSTVAGQGWRGVLNSELLRRAESAGFEVSVTADRNLQYQQTLAGRAFGVVVIYPRRLKMDFVHPLVPALLDAIASVQPGEVAHVRPPPS